MTVEPFHCLPLPPPPPPQTLGRGERSTSNTSTQPTTPSFQTTLQCALFLLISVHGFCCFTYLCLLLGFLVFVLHRQTNKQKNMTLHPETGNISLSSVGGISVSPTGNILESPQGNISVSPTGNILVSPQGNISVSPIGNTCILASLSGNV